MLSVVESLIFTALFGVTGSSVIFFPIIETFSLSAIAIVLCATLLGSDSKGQEKPIWFGVVCLVFSYGITLTNVVAALFGLVYVAVRSSRIRDRETIHCPVQGKDCEVDFIIVIGIRSI